MTLATKRAIGVAMRDARRRARLKLYAVSALIHRPISTISSWETGDRRIGVVDMIAFADACGLSFAELALHVEFVARGMRGEDPNKP